MEVQRIGHASLIVSAGGTRCLMDPVLEQPFECGMNVFEPGARLNPGAIVEGVNLVVISHEHMDHFCVRSLARVDRRVPVVYPGACKLIGATLQRMGFARLIPVSPGEARREGALELVFTPSEVSFPELGVLFLHEGRSVWNAVDTEVGEGALELVKRRAPALDLMLAGYQPLVEDELGRDALGAAFPLDRYAALVQVVLAARPRAVVPSSCGYRYSAEPWMNHRGFSVDPEQFLVDLGQLDPTIQGRILPPGAAISAESLEVRPGVVPGVHPLPVEPGRLAWRPCLGVPPLADDDPRGHGAPALRVRVNAWLDEELLGVLGRPVLSRWRARMLEARAVWDLEIVYPDGSRDSRALDLAAPALAWLPSPPRPPAIITQVTASTLAGLVTGEVNSYRGLLARRVAIRLYVAREGRIERAGGPEDEPLFRVLIPGANRRYIDAELRRMGYPGLSEPG